MHRLAEHRLSISLLKNVGLAYSLGLVSWGKTLLLMCSLRFQTNLQSNMWESA